MNEKCGQVTQPDGTERVCDALYLQDVKTGRRGRQVGLGMLAWESEVGLCHLLVPLVMYLYCEQSV